MTRLQQTLLPLLALLAAMASFTSASPAPADKTTVVTAAPSVPSAAPQFVSDAAFASAVLNSTNFFRTEHNASWIQWNKTLAGFGQAYLDGNKDCAFEHSGGPYGENIALGCTDVTGCVDLWGNERKDYDYKKGEFGSETGHFTQLVWKNTTAVGCGKKLCGDKGWFLACEYWPRGNVVGSFKEQVNTQTNGTGSSGAGVLLPPVRDVLLWPVGLMVLLLTLTSW